MTIAVKDRRLLLFNTPAWVLPGAAVDLNFSGQLFYGGTLASLLSVTNSTGGYVTNSNGTLTLIGPNLPRIGTNGLLVEQPSTNLLDYSQDLTQANWTSVGNSITTTSWTAPDGTLTGQTIVENNATSTHGPRQTYTKAASAIAYTYTIYGKTSTRTRIALNATDGSGNGAIAGFDLSGGQVAYGPTGEGTAFTSLSATIVASANGAYRCVFSFTSNTATSLRLDIDLDSGSGVAAQSTNYAGNGSSGAFVWGAQLEALAFPTSYIPTTTTSVARSADAITATGALLSLLQGSQGSIIGLLPTGFSNTASTAIMGYNSSARTIIGFSSGTPPTPRTTWNGSGTQLATGNTTARTGSIEIGMSWSAAGRNIKANGGTVATDANTVESLTSVWVGTTETTGGNWIDGYIGRLTGFTTVIPNGSLNP